jgi:hypothetical protein
LRLVLEHIADHPVSRISELLPWNIGAKINPIHGVVTPEKSPLA